MKKKITIEWVDDFNIKMEVDNVIDTAELVGALEICKMNAFVQRQQREENK